MTLTVNDGRSIGSSNDDSLTQLIEKSQQQLQELRNHRSSLEVARRNELQHLQKHLLLHQKSLLTKLSTRRPQSLHPYLNISRHHGSEIRPTPVVVLEATLLRAMYMTFSILPTQEQVMLQHNEDLKKYLQKQLDECTLETTKVEKRLFQFVCSVAHKNTEIYAQYQACIEEQLNEIRKLSDVCNSKENHGEQPQDDATLDLTNHSGSCSFGNSTENDAWFHNLSFSKLQDSFLSFTAVDCE